MNTAIIMGRLTADPELKSSQSGMSVCRFTVAVDRYVKDAEKQTDFIPCVSFGKTAETVSKYFFKGSKILVTGNIKTGSYQDKRYPDVKHFTADIMVERIEFCDSKAQNAQSGLYSAPNGGYSNYTTHTPTSAQAAAQPPQTVSMDLNSFEEIIFDGDLPF